MEPKVIELATLMSKVFIGKYGLVMDTHAEIINNYNEIKSSRSQVTQPVRTTFTNQPSMVTDCNDMVGFRHPPRRYC